MCQFLKILHVCRISLFYLGIFVLLIGRGEIFAQVGQPQIDNFPPNLFADDQLEAGPQIMLVQRDHKDRLVLANSEGIFMYDGGKYWVIPNTRKMGFAKFARDADGMISVGGRGDLGYLEDDSLGRPQFHSLMHQLADSLKENLRVFQTVTFQGKAFFLAKKFIAVWDGLKLQVIPKIGKNYHLMTAGSALFLHDREVGLLRWAGGEFVLESGASIWQELRVKGMTSLKAGSGGNEWLVISRDQGLFHYANGKLTPFPSEADAILDQAKCYDIANLPGKRLALATYGQGLIILDHKGRLLQHLNEANGLGNNSVINVSYDQKGSLWLGHGNGYSRVAYPNRWSRFSRLNGLEGNVFTLREWKNTLYVGTSLGLYHMDLKIGNQKAGEFEKVAGVMAGVYSILPTNDGQLLLASGEGLWLGDGEKFTRKAEGIFKSLTPALHQAERVYAGGRGFVLELNTGENWAVTDTLIYPGMVFNQLAQDESGWLWGLQFRILGMKFGQSPISTLMLDSLRGWNPKLSTALMARIGGQLLFYSKHTAVTYDREKEELKAISGYGGLLEKGNFELVKELDANKLFLSKDGLAGVAARLESGWAWDTLAGKALPQTALHYAMQWDNYLYLGTDEGLFQLKLENSAYPSPEFQVILKQVSAGADLVLPLQGKVAEIDAASNNVEFSFIATEFDHPEAVVYRHRLAGYNATWSAWSKRTYAEYTNLGGGEYTFEVQGKNQLGRKSEVADFAFHLATPWYLQTWAWLGYVALGLLFLSGVIRLRTRALSRANLRLEAIVQERTQEIASQKTLILEEKKETEKQRDRAEESERIKKRFFANMTHELRTPLTLILGPAAQIKAEVSSPAGKQQVSLIERNGKRLLRLINQLLDISRVESAQMEIHAIRLDAVSFVRNVVANFSVAAEAKGIALTFTCGLKDLKVDFDPEKMEKILFNLLSNAIKFTENGKIEIELKKAVVGGEDVFQIRVIDSGKGIPKADQAFVFDRFYQSQHGRNKVGSGIGMALTKELVVLHGGQIGLKSEVGHGTEFWVEMPTRQENVQDATDNELLAQQADLYLLADPHEEAVNNLPTAAEAISEDGKNLVLVVEDNADVRAYIVSCIPKTFRVMQAVDGEQGLEMATQWVPDLVISDVMMPKMDGYELTTALKNAEATSHIPVILLTSRAEADSRLQGLETGADAYLTKPFNPAELKLRIRKLIALRALLRDRFKGEGLLKPGKVQATSTEEAFVLRVKHLIEERLGDEQLQVEDMAQVVNLSKVQFSRKFKALTGTTPNKYLRKFRLDIARQLIQQGAGTIAEIGFKVGFSSAAYFSKCFLDEFGMSPTALGQQ